MQLTQKDATLFLLCGKMQINSSVPVTAMINMPAIIFCTRSLAILLLEGDDTLLTNNHPLSKAHLPLRIFWRRESKVWQEFGVNSLLSYGAMGCTPEFYRWCTVLSVSRNWKF